MVGFGTGTGWFLNILIGLRDGLAEPAILDSVTYSVGRLQLIAPVSSLPFLSLY